MSGAAQSLSWGWGCDVHQPLPKHQTFHKTSLVDICIYVCCTYFRYFAHLFYYKQTYILYLSLFFFPPKKVILRENILQPHSFFIFWGEEGRVERERKGDENERVQRSAGRIYAPPPRIRTYQRETFFSAAPFFGGFFNRYGDMILYGCTDVHR